MRYLVSGRQPVDNVYCQKRFSSLAMANKWGVDLKERELYDINENRVMGRGK
jgi:hypothetical protein